MVLNQPAITKPVLDHLAGQRQDLSQFVGLQGNLSMLLILVALSWTLASSRTASMLSQDQYRGVRLRVRHTEQTATCCRRGVSFVPYIERVFENDLMELDAASTLAAAEANEHTLITAETRRLQIAAHWADLHPGEALVPSRLPGSEHPVQLGGDGTPTVGDFAPAELGCVLRISDGSASRLIGDALDLRHRLPKIWAAVLAGQVPAYQARRIAAATRQLTAGQTESVDA
jgi:hypothetical protein